MRKYGTFILMLILAASLSIPVMATEVAGKCGVIENDAIEIQQLEEEMQEKLYQAVRKTNDMEDDEVMPMYAETLIHLDGALKIYDGSNILSQGSTGLGETEEALENSGYMWIYQTVYDRVLYEIPVVKNGEDWEVSEVRITEGGARYINKAASILEAAGCQEEEAWIFLCRNLPCIDGVAALVGTEQIEYLVPLEGNGLDKTEMQEFYEYEVFMEVVNESLSGDLTDQSEETVELVTMDFGARETEAEQNNSSGMTWLLIGLACMATAVVVLLFVWDRKRAKEM